MAVAFDVGDAKQCHDAQILQQGHRADVCEIFTAQNRAAGNAGGAFFEQGGVGEAFDDAFAVFVARAAITEFERKRQIGQGAVALINDHAQTVPNSFVQRFGAMQRLLNEEEAAEQRRERGIGAQRGVKITEARQIVELFVAIQRGMKALGAVGSENACDLAQTRQIGLRFAADFDLEVAQAVGADVFLQRVGQAVVQRAISSGEGIAETDSVPGK